MVEIEHLHKEFNGKVVLDDINLSLNDNEILSVIGKSGTGKSVLLRTIIGLIQLDSGRIVMDGQEITRYSEEEYNRYVRNQMSMVFQQGALWDSMTVGENIDLTLELRKHLSKKERKDLLVESLEMVGLRQIEHKYPDELSGGMIKRVAIARAIAAKPKYLLYDEPTTGLDPELTNIVTDLIVKLDNELKTTSLVISHDISSVQKISKRVAMLHEGKIILTCAADDIWEQKNRIFNNFIHGNVR